tara:strand:+ start:10067 stop:10291 length:225 start_codon:yes stop_codon:yes gene_type:complete
MKVFKGANLTIKGQQFSYGTLYKTVIDLRTVRRIKYFGEAYIIKTDDENFTFRSKYLNKNGQLLFHEFFCLICQ